MQLPYIAFIFSILITPALAVDPKEILDDPGVESRAREISKGLRCVVCQNQSIDDSDASLARDLRVLVRERLLAGDSDTEVIDYIVSRYGKFVLLKPPFLGTTLILWAAPLVFIILAFIASYTFFRRQNHSFKNSGSDKPLNDKERRRLNDILERNKT